jgi:hypothetical protein
MDQPPELFEADFVDYAKVCKPFTLTSLERLYALYKAVRFVVSSGIPGDLVECGVWKGGSVMMMALTMKGLGITHRTIHLFDTFDGMTPPTALDVDLRGVSAKDLLDRSDKKDGVYWAYSPIEEVRTNLARTGYPMERFVFVPGDVRQTLPGSAPAHIALLRLDTDWYESTRHELEHLFPRLRARGVMIIDDYGHFMGARKAVPAIREIPNAPDRLYRPYSDQGLRAGAVRTGPGRWSCRPVASAPIRDIADRALDCQ